KQGDWEPIQTWDLDRLEPGDWVSYSGNKNAVFRITCTAGKKVSVFEANWLETGSPGTSDVASMLTSGDGTTAGLEFLAYMAPPGRENNVTDPFTGSKIGDATHLYLFSRDTAHVTVKDAKTEGNVISRSYTILPGRYADCALNLNEWRSIYNGNGNPNSGPDRPYLLVESDRPISVFNTNFNDNWMSYFGTSQTQDFGVISEMEETVAEAGDTVSVTGQIVLEGTDSLENAEVEIVVGNGATVIESHLRESGGSLNIEGELYPNGNTGETRVVFEDVPNLSPAHQYETETDIQLNSNYNNGDPIQSNTVIQVETVVSGEIGGIYQQASTATGVTNQTSNKPPPMFFRLSTANTITTDERENLGVSFGDFNNDGFQDVYVAGYNSAQPGLLYQNNGDRTFTKITEGVVTTDLGVAVSSTWGDLDNDGDLDLFVAYAGSRSKLYFNTNRRGAFAAGENGDITEYNGACFNAAWVDYNVDGLLDLFLSDYADNRPNVLFRNEGGGNFTKMNSEVILPGNGYSLGATWCDYDNDSDPDLFVPNDNDEDNFLFRNNGNGTFSRVTEGEIVTDGGSSVGSAWADFDNDGDMDLYVTNRGRQANFFYENNGDGTFTRITDGAIANDIGDSQGCTWGDMDKDGDLDLFVTNSGDGHHFLYMNQGDGTFDRDDDEPITRIQNYALGTAMADIENDGDLDIFVATHFNQPNHLYVNNGNNYNWLQVKLNGVHSNRNGIGAKVWVKAEINGEGRWQVREVTSQSAGGPGAQSSLIAHFGLENATKVDSLMVVWPNGYRQFRRNISANRLIVVTEEIGTEVTGRIYYDADSSCSMGNDENGIPGLMVKIDPGNRHVMTDSIGRYSVHLADGDYTISQMANPFWHQVCPDGPAVHSVSVSEGGGNATLLYEKFTDLEDCSWGCTTTISSNSSSNLTINEGEQVCIAEGVVYTGRLTFRGGTLVVCGTAQPSGINFNNGNDDVLIVVSETGVLQINGLNINTDRIRLVNYGTNTSLGQVSLNGPMENHGSMLLSSLNINSGPLLNTGSILVNGDLNNNGDITSYGTIEVGGNVNNNSGVWDNQCRLEIGGDFNQNSNFTLGGYMAVEGESRFNSPSGTHFDAGAKLETRNLVVNNDLFGPEEPRVSIQVAENCILNSGAVIFGYIDICDADGIETMYATLATFSTIDCSGTFDEEHCNDGTGALAYTGYDFGNRGLCPYPDLHVSLGTTALRRGFVNSFILNIENRSPEDATNVEIEMELSHWMDIKAIVPAPADTIFGGQTTIIRWFLPFVNGLSRQVFTVVDSVRAEVPFGDLLTTTLHAYGDEYDCDSTTNEVESIDEVVGSYDPNDKLVFPRGYGEDGYIQGTDTLYYKIRFQNVGNYYASRVEIRDTLSDNVDPATFVAGPMSHDGRVELTEENILIWTFEDIILPDSGTNEPLSHGFVQFKILPDTALPNGATILNQAAIYFDFNEPIYTNTTYNTVTDRLSFEDDYRLIFLAYPNPVETTSRAMVGMLDGTLLPVPLERVEVYDVMGRQVDLRLPNGSSEILIQHDQYRPGIYYMIATDIHGYQYTGNMQMVR
ncbi:MAG: CRTAC1 family protein, partial [Bacteroidetes bacterium]